MKPWHWFAIAGGAVLLWLVLRPSTPAIPTTAGGASADGGLLGAMTRTVTGLKNLFNGVGGRTGTT